MSNILFYCINNILSLNCMFNIIIGSRSAGKTYAFKKRAIKRFIKNGEHFVYIRRYDTELGLKNTFFDDVVGDRYDIKVVGEKVFIRVVGSETWAFFGYMLALSCAINYKSFNFNKVTNICFDEFIIENKTKRYIADEFNLFYNLIDTIVRRRKGVRIMLMGNAGSLSNPYFIGWKITSDKMHKKLSRVRYVNKKKEVTYIGLENVDIDVDSAISSSASDKYNDFAVNSIYADDYDDLIASKMPINSELLCKIHHDEMVLSFFKYADGYYLTDKVNNRIAPEITTTPHIAKKGITYNEKYLKFIKRKTNSNLIIFNNIIVRESWYNYIYK